MILDWIIYGTIFLLILYGLLCAFYYFFQERLIFAPQWPVSSSNKVELASDFEDVFLDSPNGGNLHGILIKTSLQEVRGCILYFHGNTGNVHRWAPIAEELTSYGFDVFLPDYRTYGKSTGRLSEENLFADALTVYDYVKQHYPENKICLYGRSLGSAMASWLSARTETGGVVLETPFNNLVEVAEYLSKVIPVKLFLKYTFRNDIHLRRNTSPVLIFHGTKDKLVPYKLGLKLYHLIKEKPNTAMVTIPGGKHGNLNGYPVLRERLNAFFDEFFGSV